MLIRQVICSFSVALIFLLAGCSPVLRQPELISVGNLNAVDTRDSLVSLSFTAIINNPNKASMTIRNISSEISLDELWIGQGLVKGPVCLNGRDTSRWNIIATIHTDKLDHIYAEIKNKDTVKLSVLNRISVSKPRLLSLFTVRKKSNLLVEPQKLLAEHFQKFLKEDGIKVKELKLKNIRSMEKVGLELITEVKNPFPFSYELRELNLEMSLGSEHVPLLWQADHQLFEAKKKVILPLQMQLTGNDLLIDFLRTVMRGSKKVELKGVCKIMLVGQLLEIHIRQEVALSPASLRQLLDWF